MKYGQVRNLDIANGPGIRVTLFVTGCPFRCSGCFNTLYQDFEYGKNWSKDTQENFLSLGEPSYIKGFSILGGEPMAQGRAMLELLREIKRRYPEKSVWMWTGYRYEDLDVQQREFLDYLDVLVDGSFIEKLHEPGLVFKGSKNQRLIDIKQSLSSGRIVELYLSKS